MAVGKITKRTVDAMVPGSSDTFLWDSDLKGFGLKVTAKGAKTYLLQYRMGGRGSATKRYTIRAHGSPWTPENARQHAQGLLMHVRRGVDPFESRRTDREVAVELAFDRYVGNFIDRYAKREQLRSWKQAQQTLHQHAVARFKSKPLPMIERRELARLLEDVAEAKPATARYLHACLRKLFRWAVSRGDLLHSPMTDMRSPASAAARDRVLDDGQLLAVWKATHELGFPFGSIYRLLIATGQRREEVGAMTWSEVDLSTQTCAIPATRSKNGVAHMVPLNGLAALELEALRRNAEPGLIFSTTGKSPPSGWSKAKTRLDKAVSLELGATLIDAWRTHDLRRTVATNLQRLGVRHEVTEAILNHVSGARGGVAGIYQRHNWASEKRDALDRWGRAIEQLISGASGTIIAPMRDTVVPIRAGL